MTICVLVCPVQGELMLMGPTEVVQFQLSKVVGSVFYTLEEEKKENSEDDSSEITHLKLGEELSVWKLQMFSFLYRLQTQMEYGICDRAIQRHQNVLYVWQCLTKRAWSHKFVVNICSTVIVFFLG